MGTTWRCIIQELDHLLSLTRNFKGFMDYKNELLRWIQIKTSNSIVIDEDASLEGRFVSS